MQTILFDPTSIIAVVIILGTLIYSYVKYRADNKQKNRATEEQAKRIFQTQEQIEVMPLISAVISVIMEPKPFRITNIVVGKKEEISGWRLFGRQEIMRRRMNMQR